MEYLDELKLRLLKSGIEADENIIRFIDLETIPLKSCIMELKEAIEDLIRGNVSYDDARKRAVYLLDDKYK